MAATKRDYYEAGVSGGGVFEGQSLCVNFLTTESYSAEYVVLRARRLNTFTSVTAYLHAVDGSNKPTGSALATSQTIAGAEISTSVGPVTFTFGTSYTVSSGIQYAIVVIVAGGGAFNWFDWWIDNTGGFRRGVNTGSWTMFSNRSHWFQVWGSDPTRQINLSSPTDTDTGVTVQPLLQWSIDGVGAQDGDLLDIYIRKDDSNFTGADLIGDLVDATLNSNLQIISGLEYNSIYYWQVQAANSAEGYDILVTSSIWSFTTLVFAPPTVSIDGSGNPTGLNNMVTLKRIVVAANNSIFYET
ncbi:hypothetical protein LCGC14_2942260 [marine sediment metagenome]|uniref:Fibronectin type-III domain-containing protein n=1 Tax=marine sediment metagenome TaxID=412755 RepID=A0A0F8XI86_9ZZZZ